ncbi:uncharacterized protein [Ciconia boyciana]|uniref:uncharacterized protein isoform X1 n=1 Tax=Ciconia boyciana TaxID=52775 RepID=UPI003BA15B48
MEVLNQLVAGAQFRVIKEPLGFLKLLEWLFSIFAFATCGGYAGSFRLSVQCPSPNRSAPAVPVSFGYPFRLHRVYFEAPSCGGGPPERVFLVGDYSSAAQFFVAVGVGSFLYAPAALGGYLCRPHGGRPGGRAARLLLRLGGRAGRREGGDGARGGPGAGRGVPAPGGPLPRAGGAPHLRPQHLRGLRLPQPGAVDGQHLVRLQGDGLGGPGGPRPPGGGPRKGPGPRGGLRAARGGLRPARGGLRAARGLPARLRPGGVRPPRGGVRPGGPHLLRQPDVGSSPAAGGAVPKSLPVRWRPGAGPGAGPRPPGAGLWCGWGLSLTHSPTPCPIAP